MAVSRLCGIFFIGVISVDQMLKAIFDENGVRSKGVGILQKKNVILAETNILLLLLPVFSNVLCVRIIIKENKMPKEKNEILFSAAATGAPS